MINLQRNHSLRFLGPGSAVTIVREVTLPEGGHIYDCVLPSFDTD